MSIEEPGNNIDAWMGDLIPLAGGNSTIQIRGGQPRHGFPFAAMVRASTFLDYLHGERKFQIEMELERIQKMRKEAAASFRAGETVSREVSLPTFQPTKIPDKISSNKDHPWFWPMAPVCTIKLDGSVINNAVHADISAGVVWVYDFSALIGADEEIPIKAIKGRVEVNLPIFERVMTAKTEK